jgi:hypothetical protein
MKQIADETLRDSSAMKSIALLTMIFLPSTTLAVSLRRYIYWPSTHMIADDLQHVLLLQHYLHRQPAPDIATILDLLVLLYTLDRSRACGIYPLGTES